MVKCMKFFNDEYGQGTAEYLLLFAGLIVIAVGALIIYSSYFNSQVFNAAADLQTSRGHISTNNRII